MTDTNRQAAELGEFSEDAANENEPPVKDEPTEGESEQEEPPATVNPIVDPPEEPTS
jgi:hypothetical protein